MPSPCQPFIASPSTTRASSMVAIGASANTMLTLIALVSDSAVNRMPWVKPSPMAPMYAASHHRQRRSWIMSW